MRYYVASTSEIMSMVGSWMALVLVSVIVPEYIFAVFVSSVIRVSDSPSFLAPAYCPDLVVLRDIKNDVLMAENIPGNLASLRGWGRDLEVVSHHKGMVM